MVLSLGASSSARATSLWACTHSDSMTAGPSGSSYFRIVRSALLIKALRIADSADHRMNGTCDLDASFVYCCQAASRFCCFSLSRSCASCCAPRQVMYWLTTKDATPINTMSRKIETPRSSRAAGVRLRTGWCMFGNGHAFGFPAEGLGGGIVLRVASASGLPETGGNGVQPCVLAVVPLP